MRPTAPAGGVRPHGRASELRTRELYFPKRLTMSNGFLTSSYGRNRVGSQVALFGTTGTRPLNDGRSLDVVTDDVLRPAVDAAVVLRAERGSTPPALPDIGRVDEQPSDSREQGHGVDSTVGPYRHPRLQLARSHPVGLVSGFDPSAYNGPRRFNPGRATELRASPGGHRRPPSRGRRQSELSCACWPTSRR